MKQHNASMLRRIVFLALLFFPGLCSSSWAVDCGLRGNDGGTDVIKLECEEIVGSSSPLRVKVDDGTSTGKIWALTLVETNAINASKFMVDYIDNSTGTPTETIKAIGRVLPGITKCEELQMIGYHPDPKFALSGPYQLGTDIPCEATNKYIGDPALNVLNPDHTTSLWGLGYYERFDHEGLDGVAGINPATGLNDDDIAALSAANLGTKGFKPIGYSTGTSDAPPTNPFTGTFNGNNFKITGLTINRLTTMNFVGLFGGTNGATITNVGLVGGSVSGMSNVGGLIGYSGSSTITNSYSALPVKGYGSTGGLVGSNVLGSITDSYATGDVIGVGSSQTYFGGLVGKNISGTVAHSYATGAVSGANSIGGLVGSQSRPALTSPVATISRCYATGNVTAWRTVGGLVGANAGSSVIERSYAKGDVISSGNYSQVFGGLVGWNLALSTITDSYATGAVTSHQGADGGLVGINGQNNVNDNCTIRNSYATGNVPNSLGGGLVGLMYGGTITNSYSTGLLHTGWAGRNLVQECFTENLQNGTIPYSGAGVCLSTTLTNNYWDAVKEGRPPPSDYSGIVPFNASENAYDRTYAVYQNSAVAPAPSNAWDFNAVWEEVNGDYPHLRDVGGPQ